MLKGKAKRSLAFVLAACMLLALLPSFGAGASAANVSYTEVDPSVIDAGTAVLPEAEQDAEQDVPAADEEVHVIILFEQKSLAKKGFSTKDLLENEKAASYSSSLKKQQLSLVDRIEREALGGEKLEIRYQFTVAVNGVATVVPYGRIEQILAVDGVADVYLEERYELDETVQPDTATAGEMVGSYSAWADGYTGAGSRIAIIDTGLDLSHPSFSEGGYYYSLGISAASFGKKISDYNLLTKEEIKKALPNLSISADKNPPKADDLYRNAKVPFAYNYVDDGLDVSHDAEGDSNGDHGTHVAGIAAANRYVPHYDADGDLYYDKQELGVTGVAPDAQLVVMKVFGVGGGAYSSDYMAAIEDAIWLNCDSVNLSLGSGSAGRSYGSKSDQQILDSFRNTDTVVTVSAGNNGAWGENVLTGTGMTYTTDVRMHTRRQPRLLYELLHDRLRDEHEHERRDGQVQRALPRSPATPVRPTAQRISPRSIRARTRAARRMIMSSSAIPSRARASTACRELCKRRREGQGRPDLPRQFFVRGQGQRGHSGRCRGGRHLQQRARLHQHEPDGL